MLQIIDSNAGSPYGWMLKAHYPICLGQKYQLSNFKYLFSNLFCRETETVLILPTLEYLNVQPW